MSSNNEITISDEEENMVGYINSPHDSSDGEEHKKKSKKNLKKNVKSKDKDQNLNDFNNGGQDSEISEKIQGDKHNFKNS